MKVQESDITPEALAEALRVVMLESISARGGDPETYRFYAAAVRILAYLRGEPMPDWKDIP